MSTLECSVQVRDGMDRSAAFGQIVPAFPLLFIGGPGDATAKSEIELTAVIPTAPESAGK